MNRTTAVLKSFMAKRITLQVLAILSLCCLLLACEDDEPLQTSAPNEPPKLDTADVADTTGGDMPRDTTVVLDTLGLRIDSTDVVSICPPQEIVIFGANFPTSSTELELTIGGVPTAINTLGKQSLTTTVPWRINNGNIVLRNKLTSQTAELTTKIDVDCDVHPPRIPEITSTVPEQFCPCEVLSLVGNNLENYRDYKFFIGDQAIFPSSYSATPEARLRATVREGTGSGFLRIVSNETDEEVFKSETELIRNKLCIPDFSIEISGIECFNEHLTYSGEQANEDSPRTQEWSAFADVFTSECFGPSNPVGEHRIKRSQDTLEIHNKKAIGDQRSSRSDEYVLRIIYTPGSQVIELIEYWHQYSARFTSRGSGSTTFERMLRIDPGPISGNSLELRGQEIAERVTITYNAKSIRQSIGENRQVEEVTSISERCRPLDFASIILRLGNP